MENLTLISCSYNTPDVTITMLRSFFTYHGKTEVLIIDNSTNNDTEELLESYNIPFIRNKGGLHIQSVDTLLSNVKTKYALLVDTDIIFYKDHTPIFNKFKEMELTMLGEICGDRGGKKIHNRVHPWHCFLDIETIKQHKIKFYNPEKQFSKSDKIYDVGCTFFEDIKNCNLKIGDIKLEGSYYKHYEGMSWRTKRYGSSDGDIDHSSDAVHNNIALYNYGLYIEQIYSEETKKFKNSLIKC
jgi:hypothetical protein